MPEDSLRPQARYRERLPRRVASFRPERVLEVGCGGGAFLRGAAALGVALQGFSDDGAILLAVSKQDGKHAL